MPSQLQTTIKSKVTFSGIGLHSGSHASVEISPAVANFGIKFVRTDVESGTGSILARWDNVKTSPLTTILVNDLGVSVSTVEHLLAALAGCQIDNAKIEIDGPEVPIMDGSAAPFVREILRAGSTNLREPRRLIRIIKPLEVRRDGDGASASLVPDNALIIDFDIDFEDEAIGKQSKNLRFTNGAFVRELADSRTFCRQSDLDAMRANGLALGGTLENAVVVDGDTIVTPGGLRHADEAVRHKMMDALGDLSLAGYPIQGRYIGKRSGHALTNGLLRELFSDPSSYIIEEAPQTSDNDAEKEDEPIVPESLPAPLEVEVFSQRLVKASRKNPALSDAQKEDRARLGWEMISDFSTSFEGSLNIGNYRPLASSLSLLTKAMGSKYEDLNEIGIGIAGQRLDALGRDKEFVEELPSGAGTELRELAVAITTFSLRFPKWLLYLEDAAEHDPNADVVNDIRDVFEGLSEKLDQSDDVAEDVKKEFKALVIEVEENPDSEIAAISLITSTREIIRVLSDDAIISWRLYRENLSEAARQAGQGFVNEARELGKLTPTEIRKAGLWGGVGVAWDVLVFNGSGLLTLATKFPEKLGWIKNVLQFFGVI